MKSNCVYLSLFKITRKCLDLSIRTNAEVAAMSRMQTSLHDMLCGFGEDWHNMGTGLAPSIGASDVNNTVQYLR